MRVVTPMNFMIHKVALIVALLPCTVGAQNQSIDVDEHSHDKVDMFDAESIASSQHFRDFKADWKNTYSIAVGMTVKELENHISKQNSKVDDLPFDQIDRMLERGNHCFAIHQSKLSDDGDGAITYWVNGEQQFHLELTIHANQISGIHIAFGNGTIVATPVKLAGKGKYRSQHFKQIVESIKMIRGKQSDNDDGKP